MRKDRQRDWDIVYLEPITESTGLVSIQERKNEMKQYSYFICYVDRNNKIGNILADFDYELNTRENVKKAISAIVTKVNGNYRALIDFKKLKYIKEKKDDVQRKGKTSN